MAKTYVQAGYPAGAVPGDLWLQGSTLHVCTAVDPAVWVALEPQAAPAVPYMLSTGTNADLPTEDPEVAGQLWSDGGIVTVSAGAP